MFADINCWLSGIIYPWSTLVGVMILLSGHQQSFPTNVCVCALVLRMIGWLAGTFFGDTPKFGSKKKSGVWCAFCKINSLIGSLCRVAIAFHSHMTIGENLGCPYRGWVQDAAIRCHDHGVHLDLVPFTMAHFMIHLSCMYNRTSPNNNPRECGGLTC